MPSRERKKTIWSSFGLVVRISSSERKKDTSDPVLQKSDAIFRREIYGRSPLTYSKWPCRTHLTWTHLHLVQPVPYGQYMTVRGRQKQ